MNKDAIAKELVVVARELTAISEPSPQRINSLKSDLLRMAKEPVEVEWINGAIYAFTSEIGMYRIWDKYGAKLHKGYSANMRTWYVVISD